MTIKLNENECEILANASSGYSPRPEPGDTRFVFSQDALVAAVESIVQQRMADAWDECCEAFAWAIDNGTVAAAFDYVPNHNPFGTRSKP